MKRTLNIPKGPKQSLFLEYLNSEILKRAGRSQVHYSASPDGSFSTILRTLFAPSHHEFEMEWTVETSPSGILTCIEVLQPPDASREQPPRWEDAARDIIESAVLSAFNETRTPTLTRRLLYYVGPQFDGEYWIRGLRIAAALPDDEYPVTVNFERVVALDFEVSAIDNHDAIYLASELTRRWAARLSLLVDVDLYEHVSESVWVIHPQPGTHERLSRGVRAQTPSTMPGKGKDCRAGNWGASIARYGRSTGTLKMPPETRRIFRGIEDLSEPVKEAFDSAARMYQISLSLYRRFPSAALAYRVAAIDALQQTEPDCKGFSQFMRKYVHPSAADERILTYLHGDIRSSHFHAGKFELGEFSVQRSMDMVHTAETAQRSHLQYRCFAVTREALVNWMLSVAGTEL
ncbi:hypothetical protein PQR33_28065 [Paraburkholderia sediminicola]|uniref:hypothetical protein n=1 Tax=Paraburkholderia sediminicola TaxID=458836 RepID=UPI0038BE0A90